MKNNIITSNNYFHAITADSVDELVRSGIYHILSEGELISSRAGDAQQAYGVNYLLKQPMNRLHTTRPGAIRYLAREFVAYFKGSLKAEDGLAKASKFWMNLTDENGNVNSNYGYYVFYEPVEGHGNQYNWVKHVILANRDTRRAIININQSYTDSSLCMASCQPAKPKITSQITSSIQVRLILVPAPVTQGRLILLRLMSLASSNAAIFYLRSAMISIMSRCLAVTAQPEIIYRPLHQI